MTLSANRHHVVVGRQYDLVVLGGRLGRKAEMASRIRRVIADAFLDRAVDDHQHRFRLPEPSDDVRRLDRLVTDISNASRLDAELVREEMVRFDLRALIETMADLNLSQADERDARIIVHPGDAISDGVRVTPRTNPY